MNIQQILLQGAIANIGEKDWRQDIAINILDKFLNNEL